MLSNDIFIAAYMQQVQAWSPFLNKKTMRRLERIQIQIRLVGDLYGYMKVIKFFLGLFCCDCFLGDLYVFGWEGTLESRVQLNLAM